MHVQAKTIIAILTILIASSITSVMAQPLCIKRQPKQLLRVVDKEGKVGFIDKTAHLKIHFHDWPKNMVTVGEFREGLAPIWVDRDGDAHHQAPVPGTTPAGYVDQSGHIVIQPQFDSADNFCGGFALVHKDQIAGYINRKGKMIIDLARDCSAPTGDQEGSKHSLTTLADRCGLLSIKGISNRRAEPFSEGLAAVSDGYGRNATYGFINKKGEMVIPPKFQPELEHHGFIRGLSHFSDGLAKVKLNGLYGYINRKGDLVVPAQFHHADDFSEGLACVHSAEKAGYINHKGKLLIAAGNDWNPANYPCGKFSEGLAAIYFKTGKVGYIDRTGKVVIPPQFDSADEFVDGIAKVYETPGQSERYESAFGYIDKRGKYIWRPQSGSVLR
jgi:hypothetical protein